MDLYALLERPAGRGRRAVLSVIEEQPGNAETVLTASLAMRDEPELLAAATAELTEAGFAPEGEWRATAAGWVLEVSYDEDSQA